MPIYEYRCKACSHEFEEWQQMSDKPVRTCPECKKRRVERLISAGSFQLKGGGWYADGYASARSDRSASDSSKSNDSQAGEAKSSSEGGSSKSESSTKSSGKKGSKPSKAA